MLVLADISYNSKEEVLSALAQATVIAVDTETVNLEDTTIIGIALAWQDNRAAYFEMSKPDDVAEVKRLFLVQSKKVVNLGWRYCVFHNSLFDLPLIQDQLGLKPILTGDTMLLAQSMGYPASLEALSVPFNFDHTPAKSFLPKKKSKLSDQPVEIVGKMCCQHAMATLKVWNALKDTAPESYHLDMRVLPVISRMHQEGVRVDSAAAQVRAEEMSKTESGLIDICEARGFSPGSTKQVGLAISEEGFYLGLTKGRKQMRTDEDALKTILDKSTVAPLVLAFRNVNKTLSTYIKPLCNVDRVYPKYHIVSTGRFAASGPNCQNVPLEERVLWLPDEGDYFWDGDMHQIEPKIMAHLSQDPQMLSDAMTGDFYQPTATALGIDRYTCKTMMLALSYGAGPATLANETGLPVGVMQDLLSEYFKRYNVFDKWRLGVRKDALSTGYVHTMLGRKRVLDYLQVGHPGDLEYNRAMVEEGLREAVNTIIQGCLSPETRVLKDDLTWVFVGSLQKGDRLIAFDEKSTFKVGRKWQYATVTNTEMIMLPSYRLTFDDGLQVVASANHPWLVIAGLGGANHQNWQETRKLKEGKSRISVPIPVWEQDNTREGGYLAGAFDADGCLYQSKVRSGGITVQFSQVGGLVQTKVKNLLSFFDFDFYESPSYSSSGVHATQIKGGFAEQLRFLGQIRPARLLAKFNLEWCSRRMFSRLSRNRLLIHKEYLGLQPVVALETTTKTYFAEGMPSHNSAAEILKLAMVRLKPYKQRLTVHDEIVISLSAGSKLVPEDFLLNLSTVPGVVWEIRTGTNWKELS